MNAVPPRIVIPDSYRSNFRPFYLQPPHAFLSFCSLCSPEIGREMSALPSRDGFRSWLRLKETGSPMHQAESSPSLSCLWTGLSLPAALHPVSRRPSCLPLRTDQCFLSDEDFHLTVGAYFQAHFPRPFGPTRRHAYTSRQLVSFARRLNRPSRSSWDSDCGRWNNKRLVSKITAKETGMTSSKLQIEGLLSNL